MNPTAIAFDALRDAMIAGYVLLAERDKQRQERLVIESALSLLGASTARRWRLVDGRPVPEGKHAERLPPAAETLEEKLVAHAFERDRSLLSSHRRLARDLVPQAAAAASVGVETQVLLVRAAGRTYEAVAVHWVGRERPEQEQRSAFYAYWDTVGFAIAAAREREEIAHDLALARERAYRDRLTGLPNALALDEELHRLPADAPLGVLALDFDGMREANTAFASYEAGGDVLIQAVGRALPGFLPRGAFAARLHTAGDEFAVVLRCVEADEVVRIAAEVERGLDDLGVPPTHRSVYHGASVGWAVRGGGETPGQTLGRAIAAMRRRKLERRPPEGDRKPAAP